MVLQQKTNITKSLKELNIILQWFKDQQELDVEEGLKKLKQAVPLIKNLQNRLSSIENQFQEIKKDLTEAPVNNKEHNLCQK